MHDLLVAERQATIARLRQLPATAWERPSLCAGWSAHHVLAHLTTPFVVSTPRVGLSILRLGPAAAMNRWAHSIASSSPHELLDILDANAASTATPPGLPPSAPLTDIIVHELDITWAGDAPRSTGHVDPEHLRPALHFLTSWKAVGTFRPPGRLQNLTLIADDTDFTHGSGPTITGPALALAAGILGRVPAYELLRGDGLRQWAR